MRGKREKRERGLQKDDLREQPMIKDSLQGYALEDIFWSVH